MARSPLEQMEIIPTAARIQRKTPHPPVRTSGVNDCFYEGFVLTLLWLTGH